MCESFVSFAAEGSSLRDRGRRDRRTRGSLGPSLRAHSTRIRLVRTAGPGTHDPLASSLRSIYRSLIGGLSAKARPRHGHWITLPCERKRRDVRNLANAVPRKALASSRSALQVTSASTFHRVLAAGASRPAGIRTARTLNAPETSILRPMRCLPELKPLN